MPFSMTVCFTPSRWEVKKMSGKEIRRWLSDFAEEIFEKATRKNALDYKLKFDAFVNKNHVSVEQLQEFAESGAGEELYMLYAILREENVV